MIAAFPVPGKRCWANYCANYGLPAGLADRTPLLILEWCRFDGRFRDERGRVWELNRFQIDTGFTYYIDGKECHASHLSVRGLATAARWVCASDTSSSIVRSLPSIGVRSNPAARWNSSSWGSSISR